jgi:hypothetical protein
MSEDSGTETDQDVSALSLKVAAKILPLAHSSGFVQYADSGRSAPVDGEALLRQAPMVAAIAEAAGDRRLSQSVCKQAVREVYRQKWPGIQGTSLKDACSQLAKRMRTMLAHFRRAQGLTQNSEWVMAVKQHMKATEKHLPVARPKASKIMRRPSAAHDIQIAQPDHDHCPSEANKQGTTASIIPAFPNMNMPDDLLLDAVEKLPVNSACAMHPLLEPPKETQATPCQPLSSSLVVAASSQLDIGFCTKMGAWKRSAHDATKSFSKRFRLDEDRNVVATFQDQSQHIIPFVSAADIEEFTQARNRTRSSHHHPTTELTSSDGSKVQVKIRHDRKTRINKTGKIVCMFVNGKQRFQLLVKEESMLQRTFDRMSALASQFCQGTLSLQEMKVAKNRSPSPASPTPETLQDTVQASQQGSSASAAHDTVRVPDSQEQDSDFEQEESEEQESAEEEQADTETASHGSNLS